MKVLIPEGVPLANKGEEAIIRGIQDMLFPGESVEFGILDFVSQPVKQGDFTVFPYSWLYPYSRPMRAAPLNLPPLSLRMRFTKRLHALALPFGFLGAASCLTQKYDSIRQPLIDFFNAADYVILGHDGAWCLESTPILLAAKRRGKTAGILGSGTATPRGFIPTLLARIMYRRAIEAADFTFFRERTTYQMMKSFSGESAKVILAPDPAFAMRPASREAAQSILHSISWYKDAKTRNHPVVMVTVCENSVVFNQSFPECADITSRRDKHSSLIASLIDSLIAKTSARIIFLPHSIDQGRGNDLAVANDIRERMASSSGNVFILDRDLDPRLLKALVREADFLLGERTHSLIGAVSVCTPFAALTNPSDRRTHDILGDMCGCQNMILNMRGTTPEALQEKLMEIFNKRADIRQCLEATSATLRQQLQTVTHKIHETHRAP